jgi:uncharacterized membrane-anchored protein YjiN (DUF445 family)
MNAETIHSIIRHRIEVHESTNDEWQYGLDQCWEELSSALADDYETARAFLLEDCTAEEARLVSEVYEEVIEKTRSMAFVDLLRQMAKRFPEEDSAYHMTQILEDVVAGYAEVGWFDVEPTAVE